MIKRRLYGSRGVYTYLRNNSSGQPEPPPPALNSPTNLLLSLISNTVKVDWQDNNNDENLHEIYRSTSSINISNPGTPLASVAANIITYSDSTIQNGFTYFYRVAAIRGAEKAFSSEVQITTPNPLNPPTNLTATIL